MQILSLFQAAEKLGAKAQPNDSESVHVGQAPPIAQTRQNIHLTLHRHQGRWTI